MKEFANYFARPEFLWILLLALPLAAALFFWSWRVKQKLIGQFVQARLLPTLTVGLSPALQKLRLALLLAALAGVLAALAGPPLGIFLGGSPPAGPGHRGGGGYLAQHARPGRAAQPSRKGQAGRL